jgi:hypothetical protein
MGFSTVVGCILLSAFILSCSWNPLVMDRRPDGTTIATKVLEVKERREFKWWSTFSYDISTWPNLNKLILYGEQRVEIYQCLNGVCQQKVPKALLTTRKVETNMFAVTSKTTILIPTIKVGITTFISPTRKGRLTTYAAPSRKKGPTTYVAPLRKMGATTYATPVRKVGATTYAAPSRKVGIITSINLPEVRRATRKIITKEWTPYATVSELPEAGEISVTPKEDIFDEFGKLLDRGSPLYSYIQSFKQLYSVKEWVLGGTTGFFSLTTLFALCRWLSKKNRFSRSIQLVHRIITCREFTFEGRFGRGREARYMDQDVELEEMGPPPLLGPFFSESQVNVDIHSPPPLEEPILSDSRRTINIPQASTPVHGRQRIPDFPLDRTVSEGDLTSPSFVVPLTKLIRWSHHKVSGMRAPKGSTNLGFSRPLSLDESEV